MNRRMFLASLVMPVLAGCSARAPVSSTPDRYVRRGLASWYGDEYDGKPTARSLRRRRCCGVKWVVGPCSDLSCRSSFGGRPTR